LVLVEAERLRDARTLARKLWRELQESADRRSRRARTERLESFDERLFPPPVPVRERVHDLAAAERAPRRLVAQDETIAAHGEHGLVEHQRRPARAARRERGRLAQDDELRHPLGRPEVEANAGMALDRSARRGPDLDPRIEPAGDALEPLVADDVAAREIL